MTFAFFASFKTVFEIDYTNNQGVHSWLSASTLKFVNNWLEESPQNLHFINFESPNSIEFNDLEERCPYISYPSGSTLFVYIFARLFGKTQIDISFLKHLQNVLFLLEILLFAIFVYRFLGKIGIKSDVERSVVSLFSAGFWMWLPTNVWYLANIYFTDQCVILFVMAFLLVEYESYWCKSKVSSILLNVIKSFLIFAGILMDYYFWILAFVAFIVMIARCIKAKTTVSKIIMSSLWYAIPVLLAVGFFAYQLFSISNWEEILKNKFMFRAGFSDSEFNSPSFVLIHLCANFIFAFGLTNLKMLPLVLLVVFALINSTKIIRSEYKCAIAIKNTLLGNNGAIILIGIASPLLQIAFLKNHSAIHEFSMIKLGWCIAILPVISSAFICKLWKFESKFNAFSSFFRLFSILFLCFVTITGVPFSSRDFYKSRKAEFHDHQLADVLRNNTSFENVCFSFSHEIPNYPPHELAISRKRVYKINSIVLQK